MRLITIAFMLFSVPALALSVDQPPVEYQGKSFEFETISNDCIAYSTGKRLEIIKSGVDENVISLSVITKASGAKDTMLIVNNMFVNDLSASVRIIYYCDHA